MIFFNHVRIFGHDLERDLDLIEIYFGFKYSDLFRPLFQLFPHLFTLLFLSLSHLLHLLLQFSYLAVLIPNLPIQRGRPLFKPLDLPQECISQEPQIRDGPVQGQEFRSELRDISWFIFEKLLLLGDDEGRVVCQPDINRRVLG